MEIYYFNDVGGLTAVNSPFDQLFTVSIGVVGGL